MQPPPPPPPMVLSQILAATKLMPPRTLNPKIIAIHSHGVCPFPHQQTAMPVAVITTAELGKPHRHMFLDKGKQFNAPLLLNFLDRMMLQHDKGVSAIQTVLGEMCADSVIECNVEVHPVGSMLEDMVLFCPGSAAAESIYEIDTVTGIKTDVSRAFHLVKTLDRDREYWDNAKMKKKFTSGPSADLLRALTVERDRLEHKKTTQPRDTDAFNYEIANYNAAVNATIQHFSATSRLVHANGEVLLSTLLRDGIAHGAIDPKKDIVVVFACRKARMTASAAASSPKGASAASSSKGASAPSNPKGASAPSSPKGASAASSPKGASTPSSPKGASAASSPKGSKGGTKKRHGKIKRSSRKRKQPKSKHRI